MLLANRSPRNRSRSLRPALATLEDRTLLNAAMPHHSHTPHVSAHVHALDHHNQMQNTPSGPAITLISNVVAGGYTFTNFDGPTPGPTPAPGPT